jgi:diacylglycerol kinase family enzyme
MTLPPIFRSVFMLSFALGLMASAQAQAPAKPAKKLKTLSYSCRVLYEPARALWVRELEIDYDSKAFQTLRIDGVKAHGFSVDGANIITHLDNERIYLDLSIPSWKSEFREAAQGQGVCLKNR